MLIFIINQLWILSCSGSSIQIVFIKENIYKKEIYSYKLRLFSQVTIVHVKPIFFWSGGFKFQLTMLVFNFLHTENVSRSKFKALIMKCLIPYMEYWYGTRQFQHTMKFNISLCFRVMDACMNTYDGEKLSSQFILQWINIASVRHKKYQDSL